MGTVKRECPRYKITCRSERARYRFIRRVRVRVRVRVSVIVRVSLAQG